MSPGAPRRLNSMREPTETKNLDRYGQAPLEWSRVRDLLDRGQVGPNSAMFLGTVRPDGRPHAAGVGASWFDDTMWVVSGLQTQKSRNLAANPNCTLALALIVDDDRLDLVLEATAEVVTDHADVERLAAHYRTLGWPAQAEDGAITAPYSAPSAGPAPWHLWRLTAHTAFAVSGSEPGGATRWRF